MLLAVALTGGFLASVAQVADGSVLSLGQCRDMALSNNKNLRKINEEIRAAGYQKDEAFAAYLPSSTSREDICTIRRTSPSSTRMPCFP